MTQASETIRNASAPLDIVPTGQTPKLAELRGIEAVLFDVYGTLLISGSGDIGVAQETGKASALMQSLHAVGYDGPVEAEQGVSCLLDVIRRHHNRLRQEGCPYPEVDIRQIWLDWLEEMLASGWMDPPTVHPDVQQLAVHYEIRTNPVWPMPHASDCLARLQENNLRLGIISNAQFYTLETLRALFGHSPERLGFDSELQFYSYRYHRAKPDKFLYELAERALAKDGIAAENVLYVGNDMLNDILPASDVGFRTALFAGDQRSLRWRSEDVRVAGIAPDIVVTDLMSISDCLIDSPT